MRLEERVEVSAPITECYRAAIAFEQYPAFIPQIRNVQHKGSPNVWHWEVSGFDSQPWSWDIEVVGEKHNNQVISWRTLRQGDVAHSGAITLKLISELQTEIHLAMEYHCNFLLMPEPDMEAKGQTVIREALQAFKRLVEAEAGVTTR